MVKQRTALLSVYHKEGIVDFARQLIALGFQIYASGGTAKCLKEAGIKAMDVADLVGGGPILGHRVVTLSREVHAGLLARDIPEDLAELERLGLPFIDLVCVDLYPLEEEIAKPDSTRESVIEMTDIGGPTMIRSAAKGRRIVICDPLDRSRVIVWIKDGAVDEGFVEELCAKAEFRAARYAMSSAAFRSKGEFVGFFGEKVAECKYGENAWQAPAYLCSTGSADPLALDKFRVVEGTPPSFNNWVDIDRLLQTMTHIGAAVTSNFDGQTPFIAVGGKHGNACGAAMGLLNGVEVLKKMMSGDPLAIFGGLIMTNFMFTRDAAEELAAWMHDHKVMLDGIIAPNFASEAIEILYRSGNKCRFVTNPALNGLSGGLDRAPRFRHVRGGVLVQPNYTFVPNFNGGEIVKYRQASLHEEGNMLLACAIGSTSNSNTITLVKDQMLIGNGVGQQDRVGAAQLAITRARRSGHDTAGAVAYSDSFFPFPDGPQVLINAGIAAIFTSSGSRNDQLTIDLCAKHGVPLYMVPDAVGRGFFGH